MCAYNADNMARFLGSDVSDSESEDFASFLEKRGWELVYDESERIFRAYRDDEEMTEEEWQTELNSYPGED